MPFPTHAYPFFARGGVLAHDIVSRLDAPAYSATSGRWSNSALGARWDIGNSQANAVFIPGSTLGSTSGINLSGPFTVSCWVTFTTANPSGVIIGPASYSSGLYLFFVTNTSVFVRGPTAYSGAHGGITVGVPYHICCTRDETNAARIYWNGVDIGGGAAFSATMEIGFLGDRGSTIPHDGGLIDVRIVDGIAASPRAVMNDYRMGMDVYRMPRRKAYKAPAAAPAGADFPFAIYYGGLV